MCVVASSDNYKMRYFVLIDIVIHLYGTSRDKLIKVAGVGGIMYRCYTGLSLLILIRNIYLGLIGLLRTSSVSHGRITTLLSFGKWQVGRSLAG